MGSLWLGTDRGVSRYNGNAFTNYTKANNLGDNEIFSIVQDQKTRLWFLSNNGIPTYFEQGNFYPLMYKDHLQKLSNNQLHSMFEVNDSLMLFPNRKGLISGSPDQRIIKTIPKFEKQQIFQYWQTKSGNTYYLSSLGIFQLESSGKRDLLYPFERPLSFSKTCFDTQGNLLFTSKNQLLRFTHEGNLDTLISKTPNDNNFISVHRIKNELWVGRRKGVLRYELQNNEAVLQDSFLLNLPVTSIARDFEGGYWFSTLTDGLWYSSSIDAQHYALSNNRPLPPIKSLAFNKKGALILGGHEGFLGKLDLKKHSIHPLKNFSKQLEINALNFINDTLWLATNKFTFLLNGEKVYRARPGTIRTFLLDYESRHVLLGGTNGLWRIPFNIYFEQSPELINSNSEVLNQYLIFQESVNKIFQKSDGSILVGTNNGLFNLQGQNIQTTPSFPSSHPIVITDIIEVADHVLLSSAGDGLFILSDTLIQIRKENGLASNFCSSLFADGPNHFFVGTTNGISKGYFNHSKLFINPIPITRETEINDIIADNTNLYFASTLGLTILKKSTLLDSNIAPRLRLEGHQVNEKKDHQLTALRYDQNNLQFHFNGLSFSAHESIEYHYKLNPQWKNWQHSTDPIIKFNDFAPGIYELRVMACYQQSTTCSKTITIPFQIQFPFWQRWWFRLLAITTLFGIVYAFFKIRILTYNRDVVRELIQLLINRLQREPFIIVKDVIDGSNAKISLNTIKWVESNRNYLTLHLNDRKVTTRTSLKELEEKLQQQKKNACLRVHRSYIVNTRQIDAWHSSFIKIGDTSIPIGPNYKKDLEAILA